MSSSMFENAVFKFHTFNMSFMRAMRQRNLARYVNHIYLIPSFPFSIAKGAFQSEWLAFEPCYRSVCHRWWVPASLWQLFLYFCSALLPAYERRLFGAAASGLCGALHLSWPGRFEAPCSALCPPQTASLHPRPFGAIESVAVWVFESRSGAVITHLILAWLWAQCAFLCLDL